MKLCTYRFRYLLCTATVNTVNVRPVLGCSNRVRVDFVPGVSEEYLASISSTQKMGEYNTFFPNVGNAAKFHVISGLLHQDLEPEVA
jgi:hypothetical protein